MISLLALVEGVALFAVVVLRADSVPEIIVLRYSTGCADLPEQEFV